MKLNSILLKAFSIILFIQLFFPGAKAQSWEKVPEIDSTDVFSIISHNNSLFSLTMTKVYKSTNGGENWDSITTLPNITNNFSTLFSNDNYLYIGTLGDGVFRSSDNGDTWSSFSTGLNGWAKSVIDFTALGDTLYAGTGGDGVYFINLQNPISWSAMNEGLINFGVNTLATSENNILVSSGLYLFVKSKFDSQWENVFVDSVELQREIYDIITFNGHLFAGTDNGIYKGTLDGKSWEGADISYFPNRDIYRFTTLGNQLLSALLYQGQHWIFSTSNKGQTWEIKAHEFAWLWDMLAKNNRLWVGRSDGLWYYDTSLWTDVKENLINNLDNFILNQNYPNPFNPTTTISFSIPEKSRVLLKVFDILGKEIVTIIDEEKNSGNYSVIFDGKNLTSGVYIYQIQAGKFIDSKKFIVMK